MSAQSLCVRGTNHRMFYRSSDVITATISAVIQELVKGTERGVFWDEDSQTNVDPFLGLEKGFWSASWDLKVRGSPCASSPPEINFATFYCS